MTDQRGGSPIGEGSGHGPRASGPARTVLRARDVRAGATAGVLATAAMSALMLVAQRAGFRAEQPPERVVEAALDAAGVARSERTENVVATVAHFAYGAVLGVVYRGLRRALGTPGPEALHGFGFGLGVYGANYAGVLPPLGVMPWPHRDVRGRQATMLAAHALYGLVLGARSRDVLRDGEARPGSALPATPGQRRERATIPAAPAAAAAAEDSASAR